jgi:hypothetical protein
VPAARTAAAGRLAELAALGPYFGIEIHPAGEPLAPPWQPLGVLTGALTSPGAPAGTLTSPGAPAGTLTSPGAPAEGVASSSALTGAVASSGALAARIGEVRERLAAAAGCAADDVEFRVAASVAQLGLCARLLSPVLGAAAAGWALPVDTARARWVPALGGPFPLSLPGPALGEGTPEAGTAACLDLLAGPVTRITGAVAGMAVSPRVLWGNVASAVSGAATMIAKARPDLAAPAAAAATAMLSYPALAGTYAGSPGAAFRRRNCCLIYRLSPPGAASYCGDCVLGPV